MSERIEEMRERWETFKEEVNSLIVLQSLRGGPTGQTDSIAEAGTTHEKDFLDLLERIDELERTVANLSERRDYAFRRANKIHERVTELERENERLKAVMEYLPSHQAFTTNSVLELYSEWERAGIVDQIMDKRITEPPVV